MVMLVLAAFVGAGLADFSARSADLAAFSLPRAMAAAASAQICAQSTSSAMQRAIIFTSSSCRQAAAQWLHSVAQS